jgi:diguanylate cyclase (GGDEF)-like protein
MVRTQMLALRSALDEIETGVVLLDRDLRAQFINRAFRKMWNLPDQVADNRPSYVALLYHGRDTDAYEVASSQMDAYVAERVRQITAGDTKPVDVRRTNGEVIRVQCAVLPDGGRMLSYAFVTDIVRHSDELELLRNALDKTNDGVLLLDANLRVQFLNQKVRDYFGVSTEAAAAHPTYLDLLRNGPHAEQHEASADKRGEAIRALDEPVRDKLLHDGRHIRIHSSLTANGGRMLNYCDVTDLIRNAKLLEELATIDSLTGIYNRRHFMVSAEAEWGRFHRYHRPLSMLMVDIDHFKSINDRYGHAVGDEAIKFVALACKQDLRGSDMVGRVGGEEFALVLPETDRAQAAIVAERIRERVAAQFLSAHKVQFKTTISVGVAEATASMSGVDALLRAADLALYQAKADGRNRVVEWSEPAPPKLAAE